MPAPTAVRERALAPDLARGIALLGIAVANAVLFLREDDLGPSTRPVEASAADRVADVLAALLVDNRSFPLFAALLGYGWWQVWARERSAGTPEGRAQLLLARRSGALVLVGFLHAALLFAGDVLGAYGVVSLWLLLLLGSSDRVVAGVAAGASLALALLATLDGVDGQALPVVDDPLTAAAARLGVWAPAVLLGPLLYVGLLAPMAVGLLAARHRVLEEPERHLPLLRRTAAVGLLLGLAGGVPLALTSTQALRLPAGVDALVGAVHGLTGLAMALGYGACTGLLVARWRSRGRPAPRPARAVAAAGAVSLSCYLAESVALALVFEPWLLGLGDREGVGTAVAGLVAVLTWMLLVAAAAAWREGPGAAGRRPPAEALLRRLTYGPRRQPTERQGLERSSAT